MYKAIHQSTRQPLVACLNYFLFRHCGCQSSKLSEHLSVVTSDLSLVADGGRLHVSAVADEGSANLADMSIVFFRFRLYSRLSPLLRKDFWFGLPPLRSKIAFSLRLENSPTSDVFRSHGG